MRTKRPAKTPISTLVAGPLLAALLGALSWNGPTPARAQEPLKLAGTQLEPIKWTELAGWSRDDHLAAFSAYQASCEALRKSGHTDEGRPVRAALLNVCRRASELSPALPQSARAFFEENFQPVRIARLGEREGLVTGYFEPVVQGSRLPGPEFHVPVYRRPPDLTVAGHKPGLGAFPNKGARIGRWDGNGRFVPYYDRAAIEAGALDGRKLEICWLRDPSELLAIQIQGSGRVILEDGTPLRISYDSYNGYSFTSLSHALIEHHRIARQAVTPQRIREWMAAHPDEAAKERAANRSYIFFRITGLSNDRQPIGAQGVPLTPGRSIAVDRLHDFGTPFFIQAELAVEGTRSNSPFQRLMIAQDTGSAIVGPARADLYWGSGDDAGRIAGRIHNPGRFVMLLPRELDMVEAGKHMPLPLPKPKFDEVAAHKENGKQTSSAGRTLDARVTSAYARAPIELRTNAKRPALQTDARNTRAGKRATRDPASSNR